MDVYILINPNAQYPYVAELEATFEQNNKLQSLWRLQAQKRLPLHLEKISFKTVVSLETTAQALYAVCRLHTRTTSADANCLPKSFE